MDFYKRVELAVNKVPFAKVATYGQIALLCGKPGNSRQVGYALNKKITGEVPAHRIVNSQGRLSGAGAFPERNIQKRLLIKEGISVSEDKVDLKKYLWKNTLEDALLLKEIFLREGF